MPQHSNIGLSEATAFISETRIDVTFHLFHGRAQGARLLTSGCIDRRINRADTLVTKVFAFILPTSFRGFVIRDTELTTLWSFIHTIFSKSISFCRFSKLREIMRWSVSYTITSSITRQSLRQHHSVFRTNSLSGRAKEIRKIQELLFWDKPSELFPPLTL